MQTHHKISILLILLTVFIQYSQSYSCPVTNPPALQLGKSAVVCIHIVTQTSPNQTVKTYAFNVTVDTFSALRINGIAQTLNKATVPVRAQLQFQNQDVNLTMLIANNSQSQSSNVFSFVVNIQDGGYQKLTNDNPSCDVQSSATCVEWTMVDKNVYPTDSDPKFFISWVGTDVSGNYMLSQTKRLSRFSMYSVQNIYQRAKTLITG